MARSRLAKLVLALVILVPAGAAIAKSPIVNHPQGGPMPQCGYYCEYRGNPTYCCFNNPN